MDMKLQLLAIALLIMQSLCAGAKNLTDPGLFDTESSASGSGGSGSGSGEGSGETKTTECFAPQYSPPPQFTLRSVAVAEIRCHLACTERVLRELNITLKLDNTYPLWPAIPDDVIEQDCTVYQKIQGCREGCTEYYSLLPETTSSQCSSLCSHSCVLDCGGHFNCTQDGTQCLRVCNKEMCRVGCQLYEDEMQWSSPQPDMLPLSPLEAPHLTIPNDPRPSVYRVSASNTTQEVTSGQIGIPTATNFLFRVLRTGTRSAVSYYWLHTLNDPLDLASYACDEEVYVQYKAINKNGLSSSWSRPSIIDVYGYLAPEPTNRLPQNPDPNFIVTRVSPDLRPLFWKHARIEVTWRHPPEASYSLSHYTVTLDDSTALCGTLGQTIVVPKTESSAVIEALKSPLEGPVGGCYYRISVSSHALSGEYIPPGSTFLVDVQEKYTIPVPLNFQCEREWSEREGLFRFHISWSIPEHDVLTDAIQQFRVETSLISSTRNYIYIANIQPKTNGSQYSYTTRGLPFSRNSGAYYRITMTTVTDYVTSIITPDEESCTFDALPFPSAIIDDIIVSSDDVTVMNVSRGVGVVRVWVGWRQPSSSVMSYEVRVTEDQAFEEDDDFGELFTQKMINISLAAVRVRLVMEIPEYKENNCVYLQVRSINIHRAVSNWSTPACIEIGELRVLVTTEPPPQPPAALSMDVLYIIIGISVVMLVAVVIMVICVALACLRNRRISKRAAGYLESSGDYHAKNLDSKLHKRDNVDHIPLLNVDTWELHPGSVVLQTKLGHGAFGDVYQGVVRRGPEEIDGVDGGMAIKVLKGSSGELERQSFMDHIEQTKLVSYQSYCAGTAGDHVVKMIGCVTTRDPCCLVSELPLRGDLLTFLQNQRALLVEGTKGVEVTSHTLVQFAEQIAVGMEFLSSIGVVHGDLACRNMYLDNKLLIKISDFGLSGCSKQKAKPRAYHRTDDGRLPMRWMALESLEEAQFNSATDVWGYGVTVWEIATLGGFPYSTVGHKDLVAHLEMGERLERPPNTAQHLYNLMSLCWAEESLERPSFTDLRESLVSLQSRVLPTQLLTLEIDPTLVYYNVVLSTSTPEHSGSSKGRDGGTGNYWQRRDKVGDEGHSFSNSILPSIVEDEQEDSDQVQCLGQYTQSTTYTTQTIVVETYDIENGSTGSECDGISKIDSECTGSVSPTSPSPVSSEKSEILKQNLSQLSESYSADNLNGTVSCDNHVIDEEIQIDSAHANKFH